MASNFNNMSKKAIILYLFLFFAALNAFSQKVKIAEVDSLTMAYYKQCMNNLNDPIVLNMADTLFQMAAIDGDKRMQAVALCTKLDYYYYTNTENKKDSITAWVERIQEFAKKTDQPKYYYFVWSSRLLMYYLSQGEYNIALLETERMLKEAEAEDYKEGIADCYSVLCNIYSAKNLNDKTLEYALKEIDLFEKYHLDRYNITIKYANVATILIEKKQLEKVPELLAKAEEHSQTIYHKVYSKLIRVLYLSEKKDIAAAGKLLEECKQIYATDKTLRFQINFLYSIELEYYKATGDLQATLQAANLWENSLLERGEKTSMGSVYRTKADIYWDMNNKAEAALYYRKAIEEEENAKVTNEEITTAEFATLLDLQKLSAEKKELEQEAREKQLQHTRTIIILLTALLFIVAFFLYRQHKLNKQLRKSHDALDEKNRILLKAEEELRRAKEVAEESSRMKTVFIQNMSHEIRTPLNSIVGFSTILSEMFSEGNDEVKLFSDTIEKNSQLLLKMINDILDISDLDQDNQTIEYTSIDINDCCTRAIEHTKPLIAQGVQLLFTPSTENAVVKSNEKLLMQILDNLLNNAAKFTPSGSITLAYYMNRETSKLRFTITDTGIGIPKDKLEDIFERFIKLDEFSQGTGLGLPISRLAAEKLGGYLTINKEYKEGTQFVLELVFS